MTQWTPKLSKKQQKNRLEISATGLLEHRLAAQWAGYTWPQYLDLPGDPVWMAPLGVQDCKALVVVAYRVSSLLDAIRSS